jgi:purine-binding chemotaxis protein CheW
MRNDTNSIPVTNPGHFECLSGKYLTFQLCNQVYGIDVLKIQEIIGLMEITFVPKMPESLRGVVNLRGNIIPVVDLRRRFGMEEVPDTERTCVIVVQVEQDRVRMTCGIIIDEVSEVIDIGEDLIEPAPDFGSGIDTSFLTGIGKINQKVVMLLDVDKALINFGKVASMTTASLAAEVN